jgi:hypothetical protein
MKFSCLRSRGSQSVVRPKVEPIRDPTLFQLELTQDLASKLKVERSFSTSLEIP